MLPVLNSKNIARTEAEIIHLKKQFINDLKFALCMGELRTAAIRVEKMLKGYGVPNHHVQTFLRTPLNRIARAMQEAEVKLQGSRQVILVEIQLSASLGRRPLDKLIDKLQRFLFRFRTKLLLVIQKNANIVVSKIVAPVSRGEKPSVEDHHIFPKLLVIDTGVSVSEIVNDRDSETNVKTDPSS